MKQVNPNIGHLYCPICGQYSAVRKNRAGKLYFDCMHCGRIYPNHAGGQKWLLNTAKIWGAAGAPADVPAWIGQQWPYSKAVHHRDFDQVQETAPVLPLTADEANRIGQAEADHLGTLPAPPVRQVDAPPDANEPAPAARGGFAFLEG